MTRAPTEDRPLAAGHERKSLGPRREARPTIVLVHGAWADATGFDRQIRALKDRGFHVIGFGNPPRGLPGDTTYLTEFLRTVTGPIVLVGHSYGGMVISAAATGNDQVRALVYFNGWMPDEGRASSSSSGGSPWRCRPRTCRSCRRPEAATQLILQAVDATAPALTPT